MLSTLLVLSLATAPTTQPRVINMSGEARITFRPNQVIAGFLVAATHRERAKGVTEALGAKLGLPMGVTDRTPVVESVPAGSYSVPLEGPVVTSFATRELVATSQVTVQFDVETP